MNQERAAPRGGSGAIVVALLLVLLMLPILYVLSVGPAIWLMNATGTGEHFAEAFYFPLIWLHQQGGWLGQALDWYVEQWQ
jgi:hypothetical protein